MKRVIAWIAIAIIAAMFASQIDKVLVYSETAMLPPQAESYKVKQALEKYFPSLENRTMMMVILKVNATSPQAVKWYERWKNVTKVNATSFYDAWDGFKKALKGLYNGLGHMVKGINKGFEGYWMVTDMIHLTMTMNGLYDEPEKQALQDFKLLVAGTKLEKFDYIAKALYEYIHKKHLDPAKVDDSVLSCIAKHELYKRLSNDYAKTYLCCLACALNPKLKGVQLWMQYGFDPGTLKQKIDSYVKEFTPQGIKCFVEKKLSKLPTDVAYEVILASWEGKKLNNLDALALKALEEKMGKVLHYLMVSKDWKTVNIRMTNVSYEEAINAKKEALKLGKGVVEKAYLLGGSVLDKEMREANVRDAERVQTLSHVLVLVVLFALTRSLAASLVPFLVVGIGIVVGMALAFFIGQMFPIYQMARTLMITTGLGLGMDYSIFILSRFREELGHGRDPKEAAKIAAKRAGHAVGISALAASLGFASLMLSGTLMLNSMGMTIPLTVLATAAASITMLPELLAYLGGKKWFWWPSKNVEKPSHEVAPPRRGAVIAIFLITLIVTAVSLYFYVNYKGSSDTRLFIPKNTEAYQALQEFSKRFPPGAWGPVMLYTNQYNPFYWKMLKSRLENITGVALVMDPSKDMGTIKGSKAVAMIILDYEPFSSKALDVVPKIRDVAHRFHWLVGGMPAELYDMNILITKLFWSRVAPFAIIATMLVLAFAVRKLDPVIAAAYGLVAAISWAVILSHIISVSLWGYALYWMTPLIALIATLGIGTDYNVFYITRMIEEIEKEVKAGRSVIGGIWRPIKAVGPVIIGLASIMASAYFGMLIAQSIGLKQMGLALGFSALFAALNAVLLNPITLTVLASVKELFKGRKVKEKREEIIE
ncbi:hypothetical protein IPA_07380 [Ignicoccus pacificus DSM 13166]|uniref:Membrane transport protein MMPL domain-containing protein n=1 Tax=Ignicoccus pacificus DSM 13166 TaxID=940294 RepID=A0A977KBQ8_9CREN|nr:hypothetical protein IPA_07380 [Ignicoccus pacificus DSM 13166]